MKTTPGTEKCQKYVYVSVHVEEVEGGTGWSPLQNKTVAANVDVFKACL